MIKQAVIFCGGRGSRLSPITNKIPKAMVMVDKQPFLSKLFDQIIKNGFTEVLLLVGYKNQIIKKFYRKKYKSLTIKYHYSSLETETLKRLYNAKKLLRNYFLLLYSDNYASLNIHDLINNYQKHSKKIILTIAKKNPGNILISSKNKLIKYSKKRNKKFHHVEIGYTLMKKNCLLKKYLNYNLPFNFLISEYIKKKQVSFYLHDHQYLSISDYERLKLTRIFFKNKYILIDRDGVLNNKNPNHRYIRNIQDLSINYTFIKKFRFFLRKYPLIVITNQAGIATGDVNWQNLKKINLRLKYILKKYNINIKKFYISSDHFNSSSFNRKPRHGLFLKAAKENKFILDRSLYIGDDIRDVEASYNAKCFCYFIGNNKIFTKLEKKKYIYILKKINFFYE